MTDQHDDSIHDRLAERAALEAGVSPGLLHAARWFSRVLYFMMVVAVIASVWWGFSKSNDNERLHEELRLLREQNASARRGEGEALAAEIARAQAALPAPPDSGIPPYMRDSELRRLMAENLSLRGTLMRKEQQIDELRTRPVAAPDTASVPPVVATTSPTAPDSAPVNAELPSLRAAWAALAAEPSNESCFSRVLQELLSAKDPAAVESLRAHALEVPRPVVLNMVRRRAASGAQALVLSWLRDDLAPKVGPTSAAPYLAALEPYADAAEVTEVKAMVAAHLGFPSVERAHALLDLMWAKDPRVTRYLAAVWRELSANEPERQRLTGAASRTSEEEHLVTAELALESATASGDERDAALAAFRHVGLKALPRLKALVARLGESSPGTTGAATATALRAMQSELERADQNPSNSTTKESVNSTRDG